MPAQIGALAAAAVLLGALAVAVPALDSSSSTPAGTETGTIAPRAPAAASPSTARGSASDASERRAKEAYGQLPLSFVPNRGQTDRRVRYYAQAQGFGFYLTEDKAVIALQKRERGARLALRFLGANPNARLEATRPGAGRVNYLRGSDPKQWKIGLPTYHEVTYRELWPGVDMVFRGQGGKLKYEFRLAPGADPRDIRLAYRGAEGLSIGAAGALLIDTPLGVVRDSQPRSYQRVGGKRVPVGSRYALKRGTSTYGFQVGPSYDRRRQLVIDPGLEYSTYLGGSSFDFGFDIAVDGQGNAYVTGEAGSADFPTTAGASDTILETVDAFVTKLNANGTGLVYSTYLGGSASDIGNGIAVDGQGSAYVTGDTLSSDFPTTLGAFDRSFPGGYHNPFVTKLNATGTGLDYSTYFGGSHADVGYDIAVDGQGNAYLTGQTTSRDYPTTPDAFDTHIVPNQNPEDAFVAKFDTTASGAASLVYSTYLGGSSSDVGSSIAVDGQGNAYVTGQTFSNNFPTTVGAFDFLPKMGVNSYVTKLNATGSSLAYSTYLGGSQSESGSSIAVDGQGSAYVTGTTLSADFPTTPGAFASSLNGFGDAFVTKLNAAGSALAYSTFLGGGESEGGGGVAVDGQGNAYVTGNTRSDDFPTIPGAFDSSLNGRADAFVTELNPAGQGDGDLVYSTYLGGSYEEEGNGIAVDGPGSAYLTGTSGAADFPTTAGAFDRSVNGSVDVFVTKLDLVPSFYPRPKGATPMVVALVPAYRECTSSNSTHGAPLSNPSCSPPVQASGELTVGTPDANGKVANSVGSLRFDVINGNPATGADEADVAITFSLKDVRDKGDLSDYGGELLTAATIRITDRQNSTPGGSGHAATVEDIPFSYPVPCTATVADTVGSTCAVTTSADAVLGSPDVVIEGKRAIWELGQVEVFDGGPDGDADTTPNTVFARQGVFVP
jgi:hypothetical protein